MAARSYLYVPGDRSDLVEKALARHEADALIIDLEDAVATTRKTAARRLVQDLLATAGADGQPEVWVRVNPGPAGLEEVAALATPALRGFCLAKAEAVDVRAAARACAEVEPTIGARVSPLVLMPLLETATSVLDVDTIARCARVSALQVGEADLAAELGWAPRGTGLEHVRATVALASAAASLAPPVAPVDPRFDDVDAFRESTIALRDLGYGSRACIHPAQLAVVNEVFTPTADELDRARMAVESFDAAVAAGTAVLGEGGEMVDAATVRRARRTLALGR
jgi:citrate lyase subunit beta/citryl-CoA lyase